MQANHLRLWVGLCVIWVCLFHTSSFAQGYRPFSFGLWGDMPYKKAGDDAKLPAVLQSINQADIQFSIYDGDIKDGSSRCDNVVYADTLEMFAKLVKPVVYIPGDNEWTDCHRLNNGGYHTNERLEYLRRTMIPTFESLGQQRMLLERQGRLGEPYVENVRFKHEGILFIGLNIPGSNNNLVLDSKDCTAYSARDALQCEQANVEYKTRDAANIQWLQQSFDIAAQQSAVGVVIVFQGDPGFDLPETDGVDESKLPEYQGYKNFIAAVVMRTEQYRGQVLLVHGDKHFFKVDKPLYSPYKMLTNLTRVQTFGSPHLHWVKVLVDQRSANIFQIEPVIVK